MKGAWEGAAVAAFDFGREDVLVVRRPPVPGVTDAVASCPTRYVHADAPEIVRAAPAFALVFLEGHKHPYHSDSVHHRSPAVPPGEMRLCLILDF